MKKLFTLLVPVLFILAAQSASAASTYTIPAGWNLVSADVLFALGADKALCDRVMGKGALFGLNPKDKQYYGGSGSCQKIEEGLSQIAPALPHGDESVSALGFWLYTPQGVSMVVDFNAAKSVEAKYTTTTYQFIKGWNLVGITGLMPGKSLLSTRGSCRFESVYHFENGRWFKQTDVDLGETLTSDSLGHALAIKMTNNCAFNFKNSSTAPQVPNLPE